MKRQIELIIELPDNYDDVHVDLCVEDMHINEHFKVISTRDSFVESIPKGTKFIDNVGCLLEVVSNSKNMLDSYWCKGVPDSIGEWIYSREDILEGVKRWWSKNHA